jgi:hypothetical protein
VEFDELDALRRHQPAWRLLRAEHAPLLLSFLGRVFSEENHRSIAATELAARLEDELFDLNRRLGEGTFPRPAKAYLDEWAAPANGWLRKYYPAGSQEAHYDATPDVEKALTWVRSLRPRAFVGTESRLNTVFELLRQMVHGTETDPEARLAELRRRRAEVDAEIARVEAGDVQMMDPASLRDRYQQLASTARDLLSDFREVEGNFRALDRQLREQIAAWSGTKAELLDDVLGNRTSIADSDQGRSFHAFYDFLLSQQRQDEFVEMLAKVQAMSEIGEIDPRLRHIHHDWLHAGERTQATVRLLSEQLRRFLDDQVWLENRRVIELLRGIEAVALRLRDQGPVDLVTEMAGTAPHVVLPMERPLYSPPAKVAIEESRVVPGEPDVDTSLLFEQVHVDRERLARAVRRQLQSRDQVGLVELLEVEPVEQGLAEIIGYLALEDGGFDVTFDESARQQVTWATPEGVVRSATVPAVTYSRRTRTAHAQGAHR